MKWVQYSAAVALTACLSGSALADDASKQDTRSCGLEYPHDFPCIAGGKTSKGIDGLPNLKSMSVLLYASSPKEIAERIEAEAASTGWSLVKREVGMEVGMEPGTGPSPRYRYSFAKAGVTVHTSTYLSAGRTVLMVVTLSE